jgi:hypothetical protein
MDFSSHFKILNHAYLIQGSRQVVEKELFDVLAKNHSIKQQANPDFWFRSHATFTIEDAREVKEAASKKKLGEGKRVFILSVEAITREASNALLKTLEEPADDTHFFIIMPSIKRVLPTILSRTRVVHIDGNVEHGTIMDIVSPSEFLSLPAPARLKKVKEFLMRLEKEEITKGEIGGFIESMLLELRKNAKGTSLEREAAIASYNRDQSSSLKMILEYIALIA